MTYLTLGASKTDHLGLQHHLISEAKKREKSKDESFYCCTASYSVQTEKLTSSSEKVRCQLTSETETIDSSDEVHVVNNVTVPFANSRPGIFTDGLAQFFAFRGQTGRYLWVAWLDGRVSD